jgi:hypothetical protein
MQLSMPLWSRVAALKLSFKCTHSYCARQGARKGGREQAPARKGGRERAGVKLHMHKTRAGSHVHIQTRIYVRQGSEQPHQGSASSNRIKPAHQGSATRRSFRCSTFRSPAPLTPRLTLNLTNLQAIVATITRTSEPENHTWTPKP